MGSLYISACSNIVGHLNVDSKESGRVYRLGSGQTNIGDLVLGRTNERRGLTHLPQSYDFADEERVDSKSFPLALRCPHTLRHGIHWWRVGKCVIVHDEIFWKCSECFWVYRNNGYVRSPTASECSPTGCPSRIHRRPPSDQ